MKKILLILASFLISAAVYGQDIFKDYGIKEPLTLSKGRFVERFPVRETVQIGTVLYNTKTREVTEFLEEDTTVYAYFAELSTRWLSPDPLAAKFPEWSPYVYCSNNPVNRIDPDGRADFWHNGKVIGNDGVDDQRILAIKTTQKSFGSKENGSFVEGAGLSKKDLKATVKFIQNNSGNSQAFQDNGMAYTNSIEIESSADNRQAMVNEVSGTGRDDGSGGKAADNNREYGGSIRNGVVVAEPPGPVSSPGNRASIALPAGRSTFHSHPSGESSTSSNSNSNSTGSVTTFGGSVTILGYTQTPSTDDKNNAGNHTHYVFGRSKSNNNVYIYNLNGVQAVIPMTYFVTPKR